MVITGTRKGIGRYLSKHYLAKGYTVIGCSRGEPSIKHDNYSHYQLDVSDEKAVINMIKDVKKRFKKVDALINNAGAASMNHFITTPLNAARRIFDTNFFGTFLFTREIGKIMISQKSGRIVNISTVAVPLALEGESVYAASKAAVETFTKVISKELCGYNVAVNCLGVSPVMTDLIKSVPKEKIDRIVNKMASKRLAELEDISNAVDFFIKEESGYVTGQVTYLGGP